MVDFYSEERLVLIVGDELHALIVHGLNHFDNELL
jgi:hypothetical protein